VVRFVDGVEEVGGYHGDVDALPVLCVERCSGLGFGVTGADGDAVPYCLYGIGDELLSLLEK
jgi:hypothetical protein